jgi:hypothetical protein
VKIILINRFYFHWQIQQQIRAFYTVLNKICKIAITVLINNEVTIKIVVVTVFIIYFVELQTFFFEIKHTH